MLDINKLSLQLNDFTLEMDLETQKISKRLKKVKEVWNQALLNDKSLGQKILNSLDIVPWNIARPLELLTVKESIPDIPFKYTVIATDGSQISPSHHEISTCFLINIGKILYTYGTSQKPIQESQPFLYHKESDLYKIFKRQKVGISDEMIAIERSILEVNELKNLCKLALQRNLPIVGMIDGSLINWGIENQTWPEDFQLEIMNRYISILDEIKNLGVPICGYISNSRRNDVINMLRLQLCPYEKIDCENMCRNEINPCDEIVPLYDRCFWEQELSEGMRSPVFVGTSKVFEKYENHQICFFYLNVGCSEIARIEIPRWVMNNQELLDLVHVVSYEQVRKGQGYPVVLSEAHNQAVIRGSDRVQFYAIISRKMIKEKKVVALSNKELRKRGGIV